MKPAVTGAAGASAVLSQDLAADPILPVRSHRGADFAELVKARLTTLVLVTTAVGFYLGLPGAFDFRGLLKVFLGTAAAAAGAAALNQWWEWQLDALMQRTKF